MRKIGVGYFQAGKSERYYIEEVLKSGRLSYGPFSKVFEKRIAELHGVKFAAFCNSGTSALQAALHALKIRYHYEDQDEILVPALTFVATVNVVLQNNLKPVLVDVDPFFFEMNPTKIEEAITSRTRAIIPVHIGGCPCDMEPIMKIAKSYNLQVLEDSCETMFASYHNQSVGSFGDVSCFSTYVAHVLPTGVGGFACTNDLVLAELIRSLLNHGRDGIYLSIDDDDGKKDEELKEVIAARFSFRHVGYSYRATELEAAIGLGQLENYTGNLDTRKRVAEALTQGLQDLDGGALSGGLRLPRQRNDATHSWMFYPMVWSHGNDTSFLEERGIETRPLLPLLNQPVYRHMGFSYPRKYPEAEYLNKHAFYIGCHPGMSEGDVEYVVSTIREAVDA